MKMTKPQKLIVSIAVSLALTSCSNRIEREDSHFFHVKPVPTYNLAEINKVKIDGLDFKISDQTVYKFTVLLTDTLRKKVQQGRVGETTFSALQVTLAALAAFSVNSTGIDPDTIIALTGLSALTPEILDIIGAGEKAKAYSQTLDMVESATAKYIRARSLASVKSKDLIPSEGLSPEASELFVSVTSSLKVMRDALLATIPNEDELAKAKGKYALFALSTDQVNIEYRVADTENGFIKKESREKLRREIMVLRGENLKSCSSSHPGVIEVDGDCDNKDRLILKPTSNGKAVITVINMKGYRATIGVRVGTATDFDVVK